MARQLRVVVAFESVEAVTILLIGPHSNDPFLDVYTQLYALAGIGQVPSEPRRKPPCCDNEGSPPEVGTAILDSLVKQARELSGADQRRAQRLGRR